MSVEMYSPFRKRTVRSLSGHVIPFGRNETKMVPDALVDECIQCGIVPKSDVDSDLGTEPAAPPKPTEDQRDADVRDAVRVIMGRKGEQFRDDWNASGKPANAAVSLMVKYKVDQRVVNRVYKSILDEADES